MVVFALLFASPEFAGSPICAGCHAEIAQTQAKTHHARALSEAPGGRWAFGAGAQAITYVSQSTEDTYVEHGLSWYRKIDGLALTPGHPDSRGVTYRTFAPDAAILRCFQCHSTGMLRLGAQRRIEPAELGVRCEACHGPAAAHARMPSRHNIRNPARFTAAELNQLCGQCHRMPPAQGEETNFENPWNVRHQPVYFTQSACFRKSDGKLSCLSCHRPHSDQPASASLKCAECHPKPKHQSNVSNRSCVSCHMPVVNPSPWLSFHNHWIGIYQLTGPQANPLRPLKQWPGR
ncbi:MAG: cytochrome c family protein [Bryobacteraceae bacterium]|nr:cytochrome c family protein [Bryobacteraceae bacterium]MDW8379161.1 multiheme c-type cytochrome [Bryobacterales bacterium]